MAKVQILLSAYNGERFLGQQLDSILCQKDVEIACLIRDDGSTDNTVNIIKQYAENHKNITYILGNNIGYKRSFMQLLQSAGDAYDYYAFCDQDDVWLEDKIKKAIELLENHFDKQYPSLYYSNLNVTTKNLEVKSLLFDTDLNDRSWKKQMVQCQCYGCTMVINHKAWQLLNLYQPVRVFAHDYWIPFLITVTGNVIYDKNAYIYYRQHEGNVIGGRRPLKTQLKLALQTFHEYYSLLESAMLYKEMIAADLVREFEQILNYKKSLKSKWKLLLDPEIKKTTLKGTILLKMMILFSKF